MSRLTPAVRYLLAAARIVFVGFCCAGIAVWAWAWGNWRRCEACGWRGPRRWAIHDYLAETIDDRGTLGWEIDRCPRCRAAVTLPVPVVAQPGRDMSGGNVNA